MLLSLSSLRGRGSIAIAAMAVAIGLFVADGSGAVASDKPSYLALGDSVAFGFIAGDGFAYTRAGNFVSYADYVGRELRLETVNPSCPGEASGGFQVVAPGGNDNGCRPYKAHFPLHVSYGSATTQMAFATQYLESHPNTQLVTLGIGANDAFILQRTCTTQACFVAGLAAMSANVDAILGGIRKAGYTGVLEVVNYYSLDYGDPAQVAGAQLLNHFETASAAAHGAVIADAYTAMQNEAAVAGGHTCEAGLLNIAASAPAPAFPNCDVHPSQVGQQVIAQAIEATYRASTENQA